MRALEKERLEAYIALGSAAWGCMEAWRKHGVGSQQYAEACRVRDAARERFIRAADALRAAWRAAG